MGQAARRPQHSPHGGGGLLALAAADRLLVLAPGARPLLHGACFGPSMASAASAAALRPLRARGAGSCACGSDSGCGGAWVVSPSSELKGGPGRRIARRRRGCKAGRGRVKVGVAVVSGGALRQLMG